jgi:hypothetical protein
MLFEKRTTEVIGQRIINKTLFFIPLRLTLPLQVEIYLCMMELPVGKHTYSRVGVGAGPLIVFGSAVSSLVLGAASSHQPA